MNAWRDLGKLPRELWILCAATLVNRLGTMALPFLALYLTRSCGFSAARAGVALAVYGGIALLVAPLAGRLADRHGAWRTILGSLLASGVVLLCFPLARSWPAVLAMTALFAAANESFRPANLALVGELGSAEHRKAAFALNRLAVNLGMSVGPAVGGFLARVSFPALFLADGLTTLAAAAVLLGSSFHPAMRERERSRGAAARPATGGSRGRGILDALREDRALRVFLLGAIPVAVVFFQHQSSLPLYLVRDLGFSESGYGLLFTLNTLLILALEIPLNAWTARWPHHRSLALGAALFAVGFGALAVARSHLEVALTVVVWTFGEMILFPSMAAHVADLAPEGRGGEYMGFYSMSFSFAFMTGPVVGTLLYDRFGARALWLVMLGLGLVSSAILGRRPRARAAG